MVGLLAMEPVGGRRAGPRLLLQTIRQAGACLRRAGAPNPHRSAPSPLTLWPLTPAPAAPPPADHLAEKLLAGGAAFPAPVSPLHQPSGMASSEQWALPSLSSQQQHTWGLPAAAQQTALLHQQHQALLEQQRQQELMLAQQQQQHGLLHQQCMLHQLQQQELLLAQQRHQGQLLLQQQQQQAAQLAAMQAPAPAPTPGMFDGGLLDDRLPSMGTGGLLGSADDDLEVLLLGGFEPGFEEVRASVKVRLERQRGMWRGVHVRPTTLRRPPRRPALTLPPPCPAPPPLCRSCMAPTPTSCRRSCGRSSSALWRCRRRPRR